MNTFLLILQFLSAMENNVPHQSTPKNEHVYAYSGKLDLVDDTGDYKLYNFTITIEDTDVIMPVIIHKDDFEQHPLQK